MASIPSFANSGYAFGTQRLTCGSLACQLLQLLDDGLWPHADAVIVREHSPGNFSIGVQDEDRRTSNVSAIEPSANVSQAVGIGHFTIWIGQDRESQFSLVNNALIFLGGVNAHCDYFSAKFVNFGVS